MKQPNVAMRARVVPGCVGVMVLLLPGSAKAGTIWQWTHEGQGEGWAQVYDGGAVDYDSDATTGPQDREMAFLASDDTRPGILGSSYGTRGLSYVGRGTDYLKLTLDFSTGYSADPRIGADRTGGEGHGWMSSVIEFVAPVDFMPWHFFMDVYKSAGFSGSTLLTVENLTQARTLLESARILAGNYVLEARGGDLVRVSFAASGEGSVSPGLAGSRVYDVSIVSEFTTPEPGSALLLVLGAVWIGVRRGRVR